MAAPNTSSSWNTPEVYKHHEQQKVCISRPKYREGRRLKAVKVYTINLESRFLMVQGVPAIGVMTELVQLCALYGVVEEYRALDEYPAEEFTEVYLIKFQKLTSARAAKRNMDEKSFFGGILHVCYAPEYETVEDTRLKLQDRRRYVVRTTQMKAQEKGQKEEEREQATPSATPAAPTSETTTYRDEPRTTDTSHRGESSNTKHHLGFPLLPLPPQEESYHRHALYKHPFEHRANQHNVPTEDKMGTLHNAIDVKLQQTLSSSSGPSSGPTSSSGDRRVSRRTKDPPPAIRFVPRTTHLENRKRKMDEASTDPLFGIVGKEETFVGPKLPEPPKMDMEDESLNRTADLIRNTMKKVTSVPDIKPTEKKTKVKPRRRI